MVVADDPTTWPALTSVLGVTTTAGRRLLTALFPDRHAVLDKKVARALVGLRLSEQTPAGARRHAPRPRDWSFYYWWTRTLARTTGEGIDPAVVEAALVGLDPAVRARLGRDGFEKRWRRRDYAEAVPRVLALL